jgi:hypothetical protein
MRKEERGTIKEEIENQQINKSTNQQIIKSPNQQITK